VLAHTDVLGEIKRDNADAEAALAMQAVPMLDFAKRTDCVRSLVASTRWPARSVWAHVQDGK
jgi:hypothetical protein